MYLEEEKERQEYVMNETGRIWQGTAKSYEALPWVFGQVWKDNILSVPIMIYASSKTLRFSRFPANPPHEGLQPPKA